MSAKNEKTKAPVTAQAKQPEQNDRQQREEDRKRREARKKRYIDNKLRKIGRAHV